MTISEDLKLKLSANQCEIYITGANDLLTAWRHQKKKSSRRCFDFSKIPMAYKLSAPTDETEAELMHCHVSIWSHSSHLKTTLKPVPEYAVMSCHGHGRAVKLTTDDIGALDATSFTRKNVAPYLSPILDIATLTLVCKDLGITGKAIPKVIKGRQYIAFSGHPGLRTLFPGTIYSANNRKVIRMAIGSLGIKNLVKSGGVITIYITVPLTVLECYLQDQSNFYRLAGNLVSDLIKIGIGSLMGAIAGIAMRKVTTFVAPPIAIAIFLGGFTGSVLSRIDEQHQLTEKLIALLEAMGAELADIENETQLQLYRGMKGFLRSQGLRIPVKY